MVDPQRAARTLEGIDELADSGLGARALLEEAAARIDRVVPADGAFLAATDPHTGLCIGPGFIRDLAPEKCQPTWDHEFHVPDYLTFNDIARSGRMVADLHDRTGGQPRRSPRFRNVLMDEGFRSEVRATFTLGGGVWGIAQFDRLGDAPRFSDVEKAFLERAAPIVARGLRRALVAGEAAEPIVRQPGIVLLGPDGKVVSATTEAVAWLGEIEPWGAIDRELPIPTQAQIYAARVRAAGPDEAVPPGRVQTDRGLWLLLHGSMLQGTDQLALVIEPAKASEVAPLIVEAYQLSQRELDVTRLIARGLGTSEIAAELFLSPHTVRDHVKAVFEKVGVSSRGELVAKVFADNYAAPGHPQPPAYAAAGLSS